MQLNQWGDPINTVYIVYLDSAVWRVFSDWKAANEYADAQQAKYLREGQPGEFVVSSEAMH